MIKKTVKKIIKKIPIAFTQNQKYDRQTIAVIKRVCTEESNCIDVGAHKGEVFDQMIKYAPGGKHFAFEPIPALYDKLKDKYSHNKNCTISAVALSNQKGATTFNYVVSNPSYSGLIKRKYDRKNEKDEQITVQTNLMDNVIPPAIKIDFIKIDVEGGEFLVLDGATNILKQNKPVVIFEHGIGASDYYGTTPGQLFLLLTGCGMSISTMKNWLRKKAPFTQQEFEKHYHNKIDYYFIAWNVDAQKEPIAK